MRSLMGLMVSLMFAALQGSIENAGDGVAPGMAVVVETTGRDGAQAATPRTPIDRQTTKTADCLICPSNESEAGDRAGSVGRSARYSSRQSSAHLIHAMSPASPDGFPSGTTPAAPSHRAGMSYRCLGGCGLDGLDQRCAREPVRRLKSWLLSAERKDRFRDDKQAAPGRDSV